MNIKIKKRSGTRLEDGKLISLDSMSWWEPHNECWQYFLNEICEDHFVNQSTLKPTDLAEIWSHFLEEGNLPKHCIIAADRDCGGEFKNENFNDGHHWYVRYYLAEDGEIYNEQIVLIRITERDLKMFSLDELVEEIKAKHSEDGLDPAIEEVFKDIENNGAGFDETKQLGYILDLYMGDGFLALHAYRLCLPFCQDEDELDYIVELITDIDESLGSKVDSDRKNAVKIIETHLVSEQDSDEDASP